MSKKIIIGKKVGMTRVFTESGVDFPVGNKKESKTSKAQLGHFANAKLTSQQYLKEFRVCGDSKLNMGDQITVEQFDAGDIVNVTGVSKGKGFAGHMKRHGFHGGSASHGKNSVMRKAGSIGSSATPSKVWKGTRMAGRMGNDRVTVENLEIVRIDTGRNLLFVNGSVPGAINGLVYVVKK